MSSDKKEDLNLIVRIFSTDIPGKKTAIIGLCKIKGVDKMFGNAVLSIAGVPDDKLIGRLSSEEVKKIEDVIKSPEKHNVPEYLYNRRSDPETNNDSHAVGAELKLQKDFDIRRLKRIRSFKGLRHGWGLKVRGQRLKSFRRGNAAITIKKKVLK
ncbi:30S ribosomal protein S13 [archaeon CG_4_10_14_0_2_um_filter_Archaea_38_6]|nr:MAG: 30S ribosomal protein S13 [archaeon CG07_land_8_20_14_0_80_38_8]PIU88635.1 MAG: 30S ribosomal protein S13 [archaeon CG06_land_8_20_14_3_00_37_11]PJA23010.1 MAG: 30S ribosomal protein S13 [archaeon CG_4_10_14_0_2_um_filter_Archaea_38_6]